MLERDLGRQQPVAGNGRLGASRRERLSLAGCVGLGGWCFRAGVLFGDLGLLVAPGLELGEHHVVFGRGGHNGAEGVC